MDLKLKDGVVGSQLVKHFEKEGMVAIDAKSIRPGKDADTHHYHITFEDGESGDYLITFDKGTRFEVLSAERLTTFAEAGATAVTMGRYIPAHDETYDLAESIGKQLDEFRAYIAKEREPNQADLAVSELLNAFLAKP